MSKRFHIVINGKSYDAEVEEVGAYPSEMVAVATPTNANAEMTRYITEMFPETRLSETGEVHRDKLIAARDYLIALAEKVNG